MAKVLIDGLRVDVDKLTNWYSPAPTTLFFSCSLVELQFSIKL